MRYIKQQHRSVLFSGASYGPPTVYIVDLVPDLAGGTEFRCGSIVSRATWRSQSAAGCWPRDRWCVNFSDDLLSSIVVGLVHTAQVINRIAYNMTRFAHLAFNIAQGCLAFLRLSSRGSFSQHLIKFSFANIQVLL